MTPEKKTAGAGAPGEVILDFSQVKPFEPMDPSQRYLIRCTKLDLSKSSANKPKSHCELTIEGPEEVQVEEWIPDESAEGGMKKVGMLTDKNGNPVMTRAKGRLLFREFSLEPQAMPFLYEFIKAVTPDAELGEKFRYNPMKLMGLSCACTIQNEAFSEQVRARVRRFYPASSYKG